MNRRLLQLLCAFSLAVSLPAIAVDPQYCTITNCRADAADAVASEVEYYRGQAFALTNCVAYVGGTTNSARQNLTNCTIAVRVGSVASNLQYAGTIQDATAGTWCATFTLPTNWPLPRLWVTLTDATTNAYTYPRKILLTTGAP